jgi:hypothetical protein
MSDQYTLDITEGNLGGSPAGGRAAALASLAFPIQIAVGAAATAGDPLAETEWTPIPMNLDVVAVDYSTGTGVTAHATTTATIIVSKFDAAGANKTTVASRQTITGSSIVAKSAWRLTNSTVAAATQLVAGGALAVEITKQSTGVVVQAGNLTLWCVPRGI